MKAEFFQKLSKIDLLAKSGRVKRFLANPFHYLKGAVINKVIYPLGKKPVLAKTNTFFGEEILLNLPAGMDIYLLGGKSHDSEIRLAKYMLNTIGQGAQVIDVGAHLGYFTMFLAHLVGETGRVISIEAATEAHSLLIKNCAQFKNVTTKKIAASDKNEQIVFYEFPTLYSEYNSINKDQYKGETWIDNSTVIKNEVEGLRLDHLFKDLEMKPSFIKIDVEGGEQKVLEGLSAYLSSGEPLTIAMEYLTDPKKRDAYKRAVQYLLKMNFQLNIIDHSGNPKPMNIEALDEHFNSNGLDSDNLLFVFN